MFVILVQASGLHCTSSAVVADEHHYGLQEYIANKLQKQADRLGTEKAALLKEKSDLQRQAWPYSCCFELSLPLDLHGQYPHQMAPVYNLHCTTCVVCPSVHLGCRGSIWV